jgi:hypothetical protein
MDGTKGATGMRRSSPSKARGSEVPYKQRGYYSTKLAQRVCWEMFGQPVDAVLNQIGSNLTAREMFFSELKRRMTVYMSDGPDGRPPMGAKTDVV